MSVSARDTRRALRIHEPRSTGEARRFWLALVPPVLMGAALRLWRLPDQVMGDDEIHAIRALLRMSPRELLLDYHANNLCRPLVAFDLLWLRLHGTLDEWAMRLPVVLLGLVALVAIPFAVGRLLGRRIALTVAWLIAGSPLLVFYSMIARSYMPVALLATLATTSFFAWWTGERISSWRGWWMYVVLSALTAYSNLVTIPFLVAPLIFAVLELFRFQPTERRSRAGALICVGAALTIALGSFLLPGWRSLIELVGEKSGGPPMSLTPIAGMLRMHAGTMSLGVAALFWSLALVGFVRLMRRRRRLALYVATLIGAQAVVLCITSPQGVNRAVVLSRYLVVALPFVLMLVAAAVQTCSRGWWGLLPEVSLILLLLLSSPWTDPARRTSSFLLHNDFLELHPQRLQLRAGDVPGFYATLDGNGPVLEAPWPWSWLHNGLFYAYQDRHGARVMVVPEDPVLADDRWRFRNMIPPEPDLLLGSEARWLVLHHDITAERRKLLGPQGPLPRPGPATQMVRRTAARLDERLRRAWGVPDSQDEVLSVWDLDRVRRE